MLPGWHQEPATDGGEYYELVVGSTRTSYCFAVVMRLPDQAEIQATIISARCRGVSTPEKNQVSQRFESIADAQRWCSEQIG